MLCARDWINCVDPKWWSYPNSPAASRHWNFYLYAYANKLATRPNKNSLHFVQRICARDWIRTSTSFRTLPPEDSASTNFATRALFYGLQI